MTIDFARREVIADGDPVALTPLEFRMLSTFVRHPNQVLSRDQLRELVWGDAAGMSRDQVKLYVGYLRRKLGWEVGRTPPIETVRGFGYQYRPNDERGSGRLGRVVLLYQGLWERGCARRLSTSSSSWAGSTASRRTST